MAQIDHQPLGDNPARPRARVSVLLCWAVILSFVGYTAWAQSRSARHQAAATSQSSHAPNLQLELMGRLSIMQVRLMAADDSAQGHAKRDNLTKQLLENISRMAVSPPDKLKAIVITRELRGAPPAIDQLNHNFENIDAGTGVQQDAVDLKGLYTDGPTALSIESHDRLVNDLGWFGQLAVTQGKPDSDPARAAILSSAKKSFAAMVIAFAFLLGALLLGFFALILLIVLFALGNARFKYQPALTDHRPLLLESFALWGPAYLLLGFLIHRWSGAHNVLLFEAVFVAVTILIALWPMFRGMPWPELKNALGWHTGAGVFTEIGAGILGYIAGLPILAIALLITFALVRATHANPSHPISQEITGDMSISKILELLAAISIGAPFLEETMFRGALYGHLRRRWRPWLSAGVTAFLFAAIHPQGWAAIPVLGSIAIVLALLREWRGSLLASMTAHCINNGAVLLLIVTVLK